MCEDYGPGTGLLDDTAMAAPVAFEYLGHKGSLQVISKGKPRRVSHMRVGFLGPKPFAPAGFTRVVTSPAFDLVTNTGGWNAAEPKDERLRNGFMTFCSTPKMVTELEHPGRVEAILALGAELGGFAVGITFGKAMLIVEKVCHSDRPADQLKLIYRVIDLLEALVGVPARPIGRIPAGRAPALDLSHARCRVCFHPLERRVVYCNGCVTPHHQECWEYVGGCSTYACLRRVFVAGSDEIEEGLNQAETEELVA